MMKNQKLLPQLIFLLGNIAPDSDPVVPVVGFGLILLIVECQDQHDAPKNLNKTSTFTICSLDVGVSTITGQPMKKIGGK